MWMIGLITVTWSYYLKKYTSENPSDTDAGVITETSLGLFASSRKGILCRYP